MGDPLDFIDEGGWPYPDDGTEARVLDPVDLAASADDDLIALHALTPRGLATLSGVERAAVAGRFGLDGHEPLTMPELCQSLGLSRQRARAALAGGLDKLRAALSDGQA